MAKWLKLSAIYTFSTSPNLPPHYLVKHRCSKLSHNTGIYYWYHNIRRLNYLAQ